MKLKLVRLNDDDQQNIQTIKGYEYQLQEQSSIEYRSSCWAIAFNKDASIVVACDNENIKVFECKNEKLKQIQLLKSHSDWITCLLFMKKSNQFISGSQDTTIKIWQQDNNNKWMNITLLVGHKEWVQCVVINHNEDLIISGGQDKLIIFWRLNNTKWIKEKAINCTDAVYSLSLNSTNTKLVSSDSSKLIQVFDQKGKTWEITQQISTNIRGFRICFLEDDEFLIFTINSLNMLVNYKLDVNDIFGFPIQYIDSKKLLIVKNGKFLNILRKQEDGQFNQDQQIEFDDHHTFGSVSYDGQFILTWNYISKKIELGKLAEIQ